LVLPSPRMCGLAPRRRAITDSGVAKGFFSGSSQSGLAGIEAQVAGFEGDELASTQASVDRGLDHQPMLGGDSSQCAERGGPMGLPALEPHLGQRCACLRALSRSET
jgi:hypothetical protein